MAKTLYEPPVSKIDTKSQVTPGFIASKMSETRMLLIANIVYLERVLKTRNINGVQGDTFYQQKELQLQIFRN